MRCRRDEGKVIVKHANDNVPQWPEELSFEEQVERALVLLAYLIEIEGDIHLPMYEQYEAKLAELRAKADVRARARQRLNAFVGQSAPTPVIAPATAAA